MVEEAAYFRAQSRNFAPGSEHDDWEAAEAEIDRLIARERTLVGFISW